MAIIQSVREHLSQRERQHLRLGVTRPIVSARSGQTLRKFNRTVTIDATSAFDAAALDPLLNKKVQSFDFRGLVSQFDQALAHTPGLTSWAMTNALLQFHLSGSDDAALGGDLA